MSGLHRFGVDANPFGSKFDASCGGYAAGNGQRTYTRPSYTLYVTGIPDAESSDAVQAVFEHDEGFLQCRPVGHKSKRSGSGKMEGKMKMDIKIVFLMTFYMDDTGISAWFIREWIPGMIT